MRKIAIINQKGGVGKTTTAFNLAYGLADRGKKVLLIDVDHQKNLTHNILGYDDYHYNLYELLKNGEELDTKQLYKVSENLFFLPSSLNLSAFDIEFGVIVARERLLANILPKEGFDFVVLDCPPYLGLLNINVLVYVNSVIIPVQCEPMSLEGIGQLLSTINRMAKLLDLNVAIDCIVPTMFQANVNLSQEAYESIKTNLSQYHILDPIRRSIRVAEALVNQQSIFSYDKDSVSSKEYNKVVEFVINGQ